MQSENELKNDFILAFGTLSDESSPAKLPGISLDNAAYNFIVNNVIKNSYGSGIKIVRTGYRNLLISNVVSNNNIGKNHAFHFFGIELGFAKIAAQTGEGMDLVPASENIVF